MIVQRIIVHYKPGKVQEAIALLQAEAKRATSTGLFKEHNRFLKPQNEADVTLGEYEFESIAAMEKEWSQWEAQPEAKAFSLKYNLLVEKQTQELYDIF